MLTSYGRSEKVITMTETPPPGPGPAQQTRLAQEKRQERRNRLVLSAVLVACVLLLWGVISIATPQKALECDGASTSSLLQFGSCH